MPILVDAVVIAACVIAALIDVSERRIPNALTFPLILAGLALYLIAPTDELVLGRWPGGRLFGVWGFLMAGVPFFLLFLLRVLGAGDVKLLMAVGALQGATSAFRIGVCSILLAGILSLISLIATDRFGSVGLQLRYLLRRVSGRGDVVSRPEPYKIPMGLAIAGAVVLDVVLGHWLAHLPPLPT